MHNRQLSRKLSDNEEVGVAILVPNPGVVQIIVGKLSSPIGAMSTLLTLLGSACATAPPPDIGPLLAITGQAAPRFT
jgi:hypothetical protein